MPDAGQKTEQPTPRRLEKARREGRFPQSRDFLSAVQFAVFVLLVLQFGEVLLDAFCAMMRSLVRFAFSRRGLEAGDVSGLLGTVVMPSVPGLLLAAGALTAATLGAQLAVTRFGFAVVRLAPDVSRLNPLSRLRELPRQNLHALFQALLLLPLIAWAVYAVAAENWSGYLRLPRMNVAGGLNVAAASLGSLLLRAAGLFLVLGVFHLYREKQRYVRELRMTKQEVREEYKEIEGNPQIRGHIRRLMRDLLRRRMMREVPQATAVVVNPAHYAVAIRYQMQLMPAPRVVAKGKNYLAARIRQLAMEHQVPIVENPPLAQTLYQSVDVGQEIPPHLYRAVAEILAYLYRVMGRRLPGA